MFRNSSGGVYETEAYGNMLSYTFPEGSSIDFDEISISLNGLKVNSYGGKYDPTSIKFWNESVSELPSKRANYYNSSIYIDENEIGGAGYPNEDDFTKYNLPFLSKNEFVKLQKLVENSNKPNEYHTKLVLFFWQWAKDNVIKIKRKLDDILQSNSSFPKYISVIYNDTSISHATHIVLIFRSMSECTLQIDNTFSLSAPLISNELVQNKLKDKGVDYLTCKEDVISSSSPYIELYRNRTDKNSAIQLEMDAPIIPMLLDHAYKSMIQHLKNTLGLPLSGIKVNFSSYNQKNLDKECVPFSIQNKINFALDLRPTFDETPLQMAARIRAEQVVLSYLLKRNETIPRATKRYHDDYGISEACYWYTNFVEVSKFIDQAILGLSIKDLEKLYLSTQIDDCLKISIKFSDLILEKLRDNSRDNKEFITIPSAQTAETGAFNEKTMAPLIYFEQATSTLFISKKYLEANNTANLNVSVQTKV